MPTFRRRIPIYQHGHRDATPPPETPPPAYTFCSVLEDILAFGILGSGSVVARSGQPTPYIPPTNPRPYVCLPTGDDLSLLTGRIIVGAGRPEPFTPEEPPFPTVPAYIETAHYYHRGAVIYHRGGPDPFIRAPNAISIIAAPQPPPPSGSVMHQHGAPEPVELPRKTYVFWQDPPAELLRAGLAITYKPIVTQQVPVPRYLVASATQAEPFPGAIIVQQPILHRTRVYTDTVPKILPIIVSAAFTEPPPGSVVTLQPSLYRTRLAAETPAKTASVVTLWEMIPALLAQGRAISQHGGPGPTGLPPRTYVASLINQQPPAGVVICQPPRTDNCPIGRVLVVCPEQPPAPPGSVIQRRPLWGDVRVPQTIVVARGYDQPPHAGGAIILHGMIPQQVPQGQRPVRLIASASDWLDAASAATLMAGTGVAVVSIPSLPAAPATYEPDGDGALVYKTADPGVVWRGKPP